jgi:hypothetical protein
MPLAPDFAQLRLEAATKTALLQGAPPGGGDALRLNGPVTGALLALELRPQAGLEVRRAAFSRLKSMISALRSRRVRPPSIIG